MVDGAFDAGQSNILQPTGKAEVVEPTTPKIQGRADSTCQAPATKPIPIAFHRVLRSERVKRDKSGLARGVPPGWLRR